MAEKHGIFVRSKEKNVALIIKGIEISLEAIHCNATAIKGLQADNKYEGFRVYFVNDIIVTFFLKQAFLPVSGEMATIHSLTTKLIVHDVFADSVEDFKEELRAQMEGLELTPILDISYIPASLQYQEIQSGNWIVELNVPEIEDLEMFRDKGLPEGMQITISSRNSVKKVTFQCRVCNVTDHSRQCCPNVTFSSFGQVEEQNVESDYELESNAVSRTPSRFEIRDRSPVSVGTPSRSKSAKQNRIEAIATDLGRKKNQTQSCIQNFFGNHKKVIKQEPAEDNEGSSLSTQVPIKRSLYDENDNHNSIKKLRFGTIGDKDMSDAYSTASSTTGRECSNVLCDTVLSNSESHSIPKISGVYSKRESCSHDDPNLPNVPTSSQPETSYDHNRRDSIVRDTSDLSDSSDNLRLHRAKATRKKPIYAPVVLPDRFKEYLLSKELKRGELDINQLEAFFNHVKKKMSPAKIAKQFTPNVQCLRDQLKGIVQHYYMTPKAGSGEDSRFMKWLEGMVDRFDCIPSTRKKIKPEPMD